MIVNACPRTIPPIDVGSTTSPANAESACKSKYPHCDPFILLNVHDSISYTATGAPSTSNELIPGLSTYFFLSHFHC